jgi:hypothetical protein
LSGSTANGMTNVKTAARARCRMFGRLFAQKRFTLIRHLA